MFLQNIILSFCKWNTVFTNIILCRTILNHLTWTRAGLPRLADWRSFLRFAPCLFRKTIEIFESKYSRMDLVKIVEDSLSKNWSNMVCLSRQTTNVTWSIFEYFVPFTSEGLNESLLLATLILLVLPALLL